MLTFQHPGWIPSDPPASARHRAASWTGPAGRVSVWRCCSTRPVHTKHQTGRSVSCPPHLPVLRNNENVGWLQNVSLSLLTRKSIKWLVPAWGLIDWLIDWKCYRGREPGQRFGVVEHERSRSRGDHFTEQVVEKVSFVDVCELWVLIIIDLREKKMRLTKLLYNWMTQDKVIYRIVSSFNWMFTASGFLSSWGWAAASCLKVPSKSDARFSFSPKKKYDSVAGP